MTAEPVTVALPGLDKLTHWWRTTVVAAKTVIVLLAIFGAVQLTAPLRADAVPSPTSTSSRTGTGPVVHPGK